MCLVSIYLLTCQILFLSYILVTFLFLVSIHVHYFYKLSLCSFQKLPYPKAIWFIVGNEFCERFSFYGMKSKQLILAMDTGMVLKPHLFLQPSFTSTSKRSCTTQPGKQQPSTTAGVLWPTSCPFSGPSLQTAGWENIGEVDLLCSFLTFFNLF